MRNAVNDGDELKVMEQLYSSYMTHYDRLKHDSSRAVSFYVDVSPKLNQLTAEEAQVRILNYLLKKGRNKVNKYKKRFRT